ncbi:MAG TPA: hypothetical protein VMU32_07845 [Solirubrobacteraceae bacterium]|nr:hypothetical protein [Solirubrobacteraceae bacterium]
MRRARRLIQTAAWLALAAAWLAPAVACAPVQAAAVEPTWSGLEQPLPAGAGWPVGLGNVGDIEFWAPNRGLLITEGRAPTVEPGLWAYNGAEWHEYASVCGGSEREDTPDDGGRIAWASPDEFWTVSDGRRGQVNESAGTSKEREPPLEDNTLCRFVAGGVAASYAHPAFQADSYQLMHAAACLSPADCWFGGDPLEEPQIGAFQLHWNGSTPEEEPYSAEGHAIEDMLPFEGRIYASVLVMRGDRGTGSALPVLHRTGAGAGAGFEPEEGLFDELPQVLYAPGELADALDFLHLAAAGDALWAAAGKSAEAVEASRTPGQVTVVRSVKRSWTQLVGPAHPLPAVMPTEPGEEAAQLGGDSEELAEGSVARNARVSAIAVEPGSGDAWLALAPPEGSSAAKDPSLRAVLVHLSPEGAVLGETTLPSPAEEAQGVGPKGAAARLACPAAGDCWLASTQGWLFHLAPPAQRTLPRDPGEGEYFHGVITFRPQDQGLPQVIPDAPPENDSGETEGPPPYGYELPKTTTVESETKVKVPLISGLRAKLVHGTTLRLSFHLAVKARVRLIAKRHRSVVAATPMRTLNAGSRALLLRLNRRRWPTKLGLQSHALAPLPTESAHKVGASNSNTVTTGLAELPHVPDFREAEELR